MNHLKSCDWITGRSTFHSTRSHPSDYKLTKGSTVTTRQQSSPALLDWLQLFAQYPVPDWTPLHPCFLADYSIVDTPDFCSSYHPHHAKVCVDRGYRIFEQ
ncbi:hypothetical protein AVEN_271232-1 [Araneus ventricosus]|uniref:Uncharacterized protein n=1 Tax=Araneus ventricosus TaxID=182803 RepID=A0A4Y2RUH5_ARAVE|nr:hypothetical protein AVEN_271232-1 [Araneus ventricosus]